MDASPAELTLGDTLAIPGELLPTTPNEDVAACAKALCNLRHDVALIRLAPGTAHAEPTVCVPAALKDATNDHVRCDRQRDPFAPTYNGPYRAVEHHDKTVVIDNPGRGHDTMTLDHVKPSVINAGDPPAPPRVRPCGHPPLHPHSPSTANVVHASEVRLQEVPDPLHPTPHPPRPLCATLAPPTCVRE